MIMRKRWTRLEETFKKLGLFGAFMSMIYLLVGLGLHHRQLRGIEENVCPDADATDQNIGVLHHITCCVSDAKYTDWYGTAGRKEFWSYFSAFVSMKLLLLGTMFLTEQMGYISFEKDFMISLIIPILIIASISFPLMSVAARRMQDLGYTRWWLLLCFLFVPLIIGFLLFFLKPTPIVKEKSTAESL